MHAHFEGFYHGITSVMKVNWSAENIFGIGYVKIPSIARMNYIV